MRAANVVLFASALGLSFLGAEINGPDLSLDAPSPALANSSPCADVTRHEQPSDPALRDLEGCRLTR